MESIATLNPSELISWCKTRKKELDLSNQDIADKTSVPIGTIDRIFSGKYSEFKYSSIQPVISFLIGYNKETPQPEEDDPAQAQYYYNTIEGYKLIVENKNHEIQQLKIIVERLQRDVDYLKQENEQKGALLLKQQDLISNMHDSISSLAKK